MSEVILQPYIHDCLNCIWVGWIQCENAKNGWGNMYFCPPSQRTIGGDLLKDMIVLRGLDKGSIIIRYGNHPNEYLSMLVGACTKGSLGVNNDIQRT